ncbi:hypothetical protein EW146_g2922 [Bondarzewia mesenterica]|uniref:Uncharacterized protein n=1 Tax=Bondarzewia mesenterica TaxID=1095465 RepID=A0A4S4M530_9AGAM|nr:hypothetical protein EW146_g2922 [Bondarzewia mesenterica]
MFRKRAHRYRFFISPFSRPASRLTCLADIYIWAGGCRVPSKLTPTQLYPIAVAFKSPLAIALCSGRRSTGIYEIGSLCMIGDRLSSTSPCNSDSEKNRIIASDGGGSSACSSAPAILPFRYTLAQSWHTVNMDTTYLPNEILLEIFLQSLLASGRFPEPDPTSPPVLLTRICRRWRTLVRSTPLFWSSLTIPRPPHRQSLVGSFFISLGAWLTLSQNTPLSFRLTLLEVPEHLRPLYVSLLFMEGARWKDVFLEILDYNFLLSRPPPSFPTLEKLVLNHRTRDSHISKALCAALKSSPLLRDLDVQWHPLMSEWSLPWPSLRRLTLYSDGMSHRDYLSWAVPNLSSCPDLISFTIRLQNHFDLVYPSQAISQAILVPRLKNLDIACNTMDGIKFFCRAIHAPDLWVLSLNLLKLSDVEGLAEGLLDFASYRSSSLRVLQLENLDLPDVKFVEVLGCMPNLAALSLSNSKVGQPVFVALSLAYSTSGRLASGQNTELEHIYLDTKHLREFPERYLPEIYVCIVDMITSRWRVPTSAADEGGVRQLKSFSLSEAGLEWIDMGALDQLKIIHGCREEGLIFGERRDHVVAYAKQFY